ncbi:MAG: FGGY family carbohydrate kinase [Nitrosomonas sp.]|nr:FGGY family carbohydrate kinase [Nitrosomonas sp.]MDP1950741.1 FGGY family carbohydrate kinase [Nitrosomonas sp.]
MATPLISAIALDLGTTSIKAALLDQHGMLHHRVTQPAPKMNTHNGCYESDALSYAETAEQTLKQCLAQTEANPPLGLCSQRSSFLIWEKIGGQPITPLISWQDNRGIACCDAMQTSAHIIQDLTGLRLTPYYLAPKLSVLLQAHPEWRDPLQRGELLVGTLDSFMIWRWTNGKQHLTDASMAARTLLMDRQQLQWSPRLCDLFHIPLSILPQIKPSTGLNLHLDNGLTLQASLGDQSTALIASVDENSADVLVNLGTGGFVIQYQTTKETARNGYLRTLIYQDRVGQGHTAFEGTLNSIATALAPYPVNECQIEDLATNDIFCLAEPSGLGAPYFRNDLGIHFSQSIEFLNDRQVTALLLEAIIFRIAHILEDFHRESPFTQVYLSGGLSELTCLQQGIAQCGRHETYRLQQKETSLQGAALAAADMMGKNHRETEKIEIGHRNNALLEKYRRWKDWFNILLGTERD